VPLIFSFREKAHKKTAAIKVKRKSIYKIFVLIIYLWILYKKPLGIPIKTVFIRQEQKMAMLLEGALVSHPAPDLSYKDR